MLALDLTGRTVIVAGAGGRGTGGAIVMVLATIANNGSLGVDEGRYTGL